MTNLELKKNLRKLAIVVIIIILLMVILAIYILGNKKAELTIYTLSDYENNLQALGVDEEEFKKYLSIFGNLVIENQDEDVKKLNMVTNFIDEMCSDYEIETDENGNKIYDANLAQKISNELNGEVLEKSIDINELYTYNEEDNTYLKINNNDKNPYCMAIESINKKEEKIEVTYKLAIMTKEQKASYMTGEKVDFEEKTIKLIVSNNEDYEYAKYFINQIEEK